MSGAAARTGILRNKGYKKLWKKYIMGVHKKIMQSILNHDNRKFNREEIVYRRH